MSTGLRFDRQRNPHLRRGVQDRGQGSPEQFPCRILARARGTDTAETVHRLSAEVRGDPHGGDQQRTPRRPPLGLRVQQGGTVLAARVEDVAGAGLHRDGQTERVEPVGDPRDAPGQAGAHRVEVHVIQRQPDAVVAEFGQYIQCVIEPQIAQAVRAVAQTDTHVGLTFLASRRATGTSPASSAAETGAPERAARAAWSGISARIPPPTARWVNAGDGLSTACTKGRPAVTT
jgi:hypothetical protein